MVSQETVQELSVGNFSEARNKEGLVIVDFYAEWCMPCVMMAPIFESLSEKHKDAKFAKINIDDAHEVSQENEVTSIPCLIFFKDGKEVDRVVGSMPEEELDEKIKGLI